GDIGRAAGDGEPRGALAGARARCGSDGLRGAALGALLEGVDVEERIAFSGQARGDDVEQASLDHVGVALLAGPQQQAVRGLDRGDAGAGLAVGDIRRELEVIAEGLVRGDRKSTRLNSSHVSISY